MPTIKDSSSIEEVLQYIVACYGAEIYQEKQRLSNLIADLYTGEERLKRLYRRMVMEDAVSQQLYAISLKPIQEREGFYSRLVFQFKEANFYEEAFARQVLDVFLHGMNLLLVEPISTKATEEDGEWYDEYGVKYSADRKKLIRAPEKLYGNYRVLDGTVVICDEAFWCCGNLCKIALPSSVTSIGDKAFLCCENLSKITLPPGVTSIGDQAFGFCENLQEINVTESNEFYRTIDGVLYTKDLKTIICYPAGKKNENFVIPSGVTNIGDYTFRDCKSLCEITLPPGVTNIGDYTFSGCWNLQEIALPPSVTSIGDGAFKLCENLCEITLPLGVTNIGDYTFSGCNNLQEIALPPGVTNIGDYTFNWCWHLQEITLPLSVTSVGDNTFNWCLNLQQINIPAGTLEKFKKLLPEWTNKLHEI